jgi:hypothetical protein
MNKILPLALTFIIRITAYAESDSTSAAGLTTKQSPTTSIEKLKKNDYGQNFIDVFLDKHKHPKVVDTLEPFAQYDLTWLNGNDRRHETPFAGKYFTPIVMVDVNYTASGAHPIDNTVVGSTALARNNEVEVSLASLGGEFDYKNVRAKIQLQFGTRATVVPRNDASWNRGGYNLNTAYRYFSEAYGGYHFNVMHGLNVDAGIFMAYVGLFSYYNDENWSYKPSYTYDNTP